MEGEKLTCCHQWFWDNNPVSDSNFRSLFEFVSVRYRKHDSATADTYATAKCKVCGRIVEVVSYWGDSTWIKEGI